MDLAAAIQQLKAEVDAFGQGTKDQPAEGSSAWFLLRAKQLGLQALRSMERAKIDSPRAAELHYRRLASTCKLPEPE